MSWPGINIFQHKGHWIVAYSFESNYVVVLEVVQQPSLFGERIDEVEWRPEQFCNNNFFTFSGRISVLPPCVFGDKNGSKRPLPNNISSAEISPLKLWKTFETTDSCFLGSKCNGYFEVVFARPHRVERGIVQHTMTDYTRNSRPNI